MSRSIKIGLFVTLVTLFTSAAFYGWQIFFTSNFQIDKPDVVFTIYPKSTFTDVLDSLTKYQIVHDRLSFAFVSKLMGYQDGVKPGKYLIPTNGGNREVVGMLRAGAQHPLSVTIGIVRLKPELARVLSAKLIVPPDSFLIRLNNPTYTQQFGFDTANIQSMFIPNTYQVYWTTSPDELFKRMQREYNKFWTRQRDSLAQKLKLSRQQVSVLASIVQAETNKTDEMPRVAGVYLNRLRQNWPLQADPTLIFATRDFMARRVTYTHRDFESPYNTYKYTGLPPGPINLPTIPAILATLNPESHNYMFFCAKSDFSGYHEFFETYDQHLAYARGYHKALDGAGIGLQ